MRWKHKYIVGMTVMSMFFTLPLVSADDDGDIVVFGEEFEPKTETVETSATNETPPTDSSEVTVETPEEKITETESPATSEETQAGTTESTEPPAEAPVENVAPPEVQEPVEEIKPEIKVENLNTPVGDGEVYNDNTSETAAGYENSSGDEGNYSDNPSTETPMEEITPEVEVTPLSNDTPNENIPVEENTTFTENENFYTSETPSTVETKNETFETDEPLVVTTSPSEGEFGSGEVYNGYPTSGDGYTTNGEIPVADGTTVTTEPPATTTKKTKKSGKTEKKLKTQKARFVKLLSDDTYEYYLDRSAVRWVNMPYSTSEYMADVWIRMIEKTSGQSEDIPDDLYQYLNSESSEIADAAEKGRVYNEVDEKVLRSRKYFLEHYYIRPKTKQVQFLCELEVIGRPQNAISERAYDYKNWEYLIPGSVESYIYSGVIAELGTGKANKRGHMTFVDMLDEYARIALN